METEKINQRKDCRMCGSENLELVIDLGQSGLANAFYKKEDFVKDVKYPLRTFFCHDCNLMQLTDVVDKYELFSNYVYFFGAVPSLPKHFVEYAKFVTEKFVSNKENDFIVEIGSNDGLLLKAFQEEGVKKVLGVDIAENVVEAANNIGVHSIASPFTKEISQKIRNESGSAKIIIGNNVIAHIDDYESLFSGISSLLSEDGVFIMEAPYLVDMFENLTFDTIYHEHLNYMAVRPLQKFLAKYGMEIFDVKIMPVHGQSIRIFAGKKGEHNVENIVGELVRKELEMGLDRVETYKKLFSEIEAEKKELLEILKKIKSEGKSIAGYGAPAKGMTLLNYFEIGPETLEFITEQMPTKIGKMAPGVGVEVINVEEGRNRKPDYFLLLAWNFRDPILKKEEKYLADGGHFIVPGRKIEII